MLIVALDTSKKEPLYEQIYNSIKEEIITGVLPFGARLPSARRLSKHLDVSLSGRRTGRASHSS